MPGPAASGFRCKDCGGPIFLDDFGWNHIRIEDVAPCADKREQDEILLDDREGMIA